MKRFIEGEDRTQITLLPECLDDYIAEDNPVRVVEVFVDQLDLRPLGFEGAELWHRLLGWPASASGRLCHGDRAHGRPLPEAMVLKETRFNSQIPTPFPHRFPLNSHALTSVEGLVGQDGIDAAIQTTSTSKVRRVAFGGCGPPQP
jgi:hypothetical protein